MVNVVNFPELNECSEERPVVSNGWVSSPACKVPTMPPKRDLWRDGVGSSKYVSHTIFGADPHGLDSLTWGSMCGQMSHILLLSMLCDVTRGVGRHVENNNPSFNKIHHRWKSTMRILTHTTLHGLLANIWIIHEVFGLAPVVETAKKANILWCIMVLHKRWYCGANCRSSDNDVKKMATLHLCRSPSLHNIEKGILPLQKNNLMSSNQSLSLYVEKWDRYYFAMDSINEWINLNFFNGFGFNTTEMRAII